MAKDIPALVVSIVAIVFSFLNTAFVYANEFSFYAHMPSNQIEACRRLLVTTKGKKIAADRRILWFGPTWNVSARRPRFNFRECRDWLIRSFDAYLKAAGDDEKSPQDPAVDLIAQPLRNNAGWERYMRQAGSTAYSLSVMLYGPDDFLAAGSGSWINLRSPTLRFDGNRCLFQAEASEYWALLTCVNTTWEDPTTSGALRASSPWGTTTFYQIGLELYASFSAATEDAVENLQGQCCHFSLMDRHSGPGRDRPSSLVNINKQGFYTKEFAVHMQEKTAATIYGYAKSLVINSHVLAKGDLPDIPKRRTRETYKEAALSLLDAYLEERGQDKQVDLRHDYEEADEVILDAVRNEADLARWFSYDYEELNNLFTRQYQVFLAIKIKRLMKKAAVYDDRLVQMGCLKGPLWIG